MSRRARLITLLVPLAGFLAAATIILTRLDVARIGDALLQADMRWFAVALLMALVAIVFVAAKVSTLFRAGGMPVTPRRAVSAVFAAMTVNGVVPGRGGDLLRAALLADDRRSVAPAVGLVLIERIIDVFVLGFASTVAGAVGGDLSYAYVGAACCAVALGGAGVLSLGERSPVLRDKAARVASAARRLAGAPGSVSVAAVLSAGAWGCNVLALGACMRAVGVLMPALQLVQVGPLTILAGVVPVSFSGLGTRDLALVTLAPTLDSEALVAAALLYGVIQAAALPIIGAFSLGRETLATYRRLAKDVAADA